VDIPRYLPVLFNRKAIVLLTADEILLVVLAGRFSTLGSYTAPALLRVSADVAPQSLARNDPNDRVRFHETIGRFSTRRPLLEQTIGLAHVWVLTDGTPPGGPGELMSAGRIRLAMDQRAYVGGRVQGRYSG
jgi:hypothetical protein